MDKTNARTESPLWIRAVERYREELEENDDYEDIIGVGSLQDLLDEMKNLESVFPTENTGFSSLGRLGPKLKFVDDFSAVIALYCGTNATLTALVWGSIRLMLRLASSAQDSLRDILDMLEELSFTLPRFQAYEKTLSLDGALEMALIDVYTEVICFYARSIHFFRSHPHVLLRRGAWEEFRTDFSHTIRRIKKQSSIVESEADLARMRNGDAKYQEVLELLEGLKKSKIPEQDDIRCYHLPSELNTRFWGREEVLKAIDAALDPSVRATSLKSLALHGMGGVGKTQIALQYANKSRDRFNVVLWVAAESSISIGQSFLGIARDLGLIKSAEEIQDPAAAILRVKSWLATSQQPWLVILDNADDPETLRVAWPGNTQGSVLVTSRDFNPALGHAQIGFHVQPFDDTTGSDVLLRLIGLDVELPSNRERAKEITQALGGLPLALGQIGGFIIQRKCPLKDFLALYERNTAKIDSRKTGLSDYEHTLSTVWNMSFNKLSGDPRRLLNLLAFFAPDAISEGMLIEGSELPNLGEEFEFLSDEMDLGDAEESLLQAALINKNIEDAVLSIHRLVQAAITRHLTKDDQVKYFDVAVRIVSCGFPNTWREDVGHQFQAWEKCESYLPHVNHLVTHSKRYNIKSANTQFYGELLLQCSWYLYEREWYNVARGFVDAALQTFEDKTSLAFASAIDLSGLIDLDMNNPDAALVSFNKTLEIRERLLGLDDPLIASCYNNIALSYTEMGELEKAYHTHEKAIFIRLRTNSDRIGNSYSNMSSLLLRMGKPDEAEKMLKKCPSLKDFTDETFLKTGNPRFSGDMVLLSRIRLAQGNLDDAMRLASKALTFRQRLLGNRLKTCDSLYDVSSLLYKQGQVSSAIELLLQLIAIAETLNEAEGQLARANYKLSLLYGEKGMEQEGQSFKTRAVSLKDKLRPEDKGKRVEESDFTKLCLFMLW